MSPPYQLPRGWEWTKLNEIVQELESGGRPRGGVRGITSGVPSIGGEHLSDDGGFNFDSVRFVPKSFAASMNRGHLKPQDILIVKDGATTGKTSFVAAGFRFKEAVLNEHVFRLRVFPEVATQRYVFHFLKGPLGQKMIQDSFRGSAQGGINQRFPEFVSVPLAPLSEQEKIVSKLEATLGRVSSSRHALARVPIILKTLGQSVLDAAVTGKLVEQDANDEPATRLLERVGRDNRIKSKDGKSNGVYEKKYLSRKPQVVSRKEMPKLPPGWDWTALGAIADVKGGVTKGRRFHGKRTAKVPYLRVANVQAGYLDLRVMKEIEVLPDEIDEYHLELGDVLFTEGGDADKLGRGTVWHNEITNCIHQNHIFRARLITKEILPEFISFVSQSSFGRDYFLSVANQTVNLASINITNLRAFPISLPPANEQLRIVTKIADLLARSNAVATVCQSAVGSVRQAELSILAKAFRGGLVQQDPNDKPASVLLERIRAQRATATKRGKYRLEEFASPPTIAPKA